MSIAQRCAGQFDRRARSRGSHYYHESAVEITDVTDQWLMALVYGSQREPYEVTVDWSDDNFEVFRASCDCPYFEDGHLCKHIWATLLEIDELALLDVVPDQQVKFERLRDDGGGRREMPDGDLLEHDYDESPEGLLDVPAGPRANERHPNDDAWHVPFRELQRHMFHEGQPSRRRVEGAYHRCRIWYVLDVAETAAKSQVVIDLFVQDRKKNGDFGAVKRMTLSPEMLDRVDDPSDYELLSQLAACRDDAASHLYYNSYQYRNFGSVNTLRLPQAMHRLLLPRLAATGRFRWMLDTNDDFEQGNTIRWGGDAEWDFRLRILADDDAQQWRVVGEFHRDGEEPLPNSAAVCVIANSLFLTKTTLQPLRPDVSSSWLQWAIRNLPTHVPYDRRETFIEVLLKAPNLPTVVWPDNLELEQVVEPPTPCLRIREERLSQRRRLTGDVSFLYGHTEFRLNTDFSGVPERNREDGPIARIRRRDSQHEQQRIDEILAIPMVSLDRYSSETGSGLQIKTSDFPEIVEQLLSRGWRVEAEGRQFRTAGDFRINVRSDIDWFELDASVDFGGVTAQLPDLLQAARRGDKFVRLGDGSQGMLPEDWLEQCNGLAEMGQAADGKVRFQRSQALLLDALLADQKNLSVDRTFRKFRQRLQSFDGVAPKNAPRTFHGTLREYQREGLGWFKFLEQLGVGGCLADDMGLGKTVQVLALLESHRTKRTSKDAPRLPSLAVVPKSLIFNWIDEARRFTPQLKVLNYTGVGRQELVDQFDDTHLILTTYGTLRRDIFQLKERRFNYVILDEAQAIKNAGSQAAKASLLLPSRHRLALTGTPIENHLGELWSLFEFLNPGMLGRSRAFARVCKNARTNDGQMLSELSRAIAPFVLRRTKRQVLTELPEKTEQTIYCELSPRERTAYNELRDFYRAKLSKVIDKKGLEQAKIHVLEALLRLRQAACHLGLIDRDKAHQGSAKIDTLLEQLDEIIGEGHKALVFSQFTSLLAIVRRRLDAKGIRYEYLDGQTRRRKEIVDRFQRSDGCEVFLISLKAGGQGLNLTEADYVFILDPWWNPAVEMQAIDRVHRIGQTQPVFAYRIIASDTVEEKVLELQGSKRELADAIITANDNLIRELTADDLQRILS